MSEEVNIIVHEDAREIVTIVEENIVSIEIVEDTQVTVEIAQIGDPGPQGLSAYEVWIAMGNTGTEQDFIDDLRPFNMTIGPTAPTAPEVNDLWIDTNI